ncbi:aldo/keto reductase [Nitrospirillum sp. BR 11163]|uniref:aldo/keto reductase n=1 Tax=Nitrospirillum sp. BR 11163 TaxID=3104323 RepID=UPI002AFE5A7A|nr:aldo/keto reductase [Nitrospirillum sp. BR 11163]MEA1672993.1 aldo/keto reductase [Nitrospirillum sp. BR 11163]
MPGTPTHTPPVPDAQSCLHAEGPRLSPLVWGAWRSREGEETGTPAKLARFLDGCLELGISSFDHADIYGDYGAEALFGQALKEWGGKRSALQLVTKCDIALLSPQRPGHVVKHYNTCGDHIIASVEQSLRDLGTDYVDLLLLHRPDPLMNPDNTADALDRLLRSGVVRHVGVSNHNPSQVRLLQSRLGRPLVTNQIEFSVTNLSPLFDGTLDQALELRMRPMAWSPLGGGGLFTGATEQARRTLAALEAVGAEMGVGDPGTVALAWLMRHPSRPVPVLGTTRLDRVHAYTQAAQLKMPRQHWFQILEASQGHEVP